MANTRIGNKILIDSTGSITDVPTKVMYILFTPNTANDELTLRETSSGSDCFYIRGSSAKQTDIYRFEMCPLVFANGIFVQTLTSGAKAVLVTTQTGGNK